MCVQHTPVLSQANQQIMKEKGKRKSGKQKDKKRGGKRGKKEKKKVSIQLTPGSVQHT